MLQRSHCGTTQTWANYNKYTLKHTAGKSQGLKNKKQSKSPKQWADTRTMKKAVECGATLGTGAGVGG
jgi:hypothetical protein